MPKSSAITQETVDEVALALLSQGLTPSVNLVQAELKKKTGSAGGTQVVTRLLANWRSRAAESLGPKLRPGISEALSSIADQFISEAVKHAENLLQEEARAIRLDGEAFKAQCSAEVANAVAATEEIKSILGKTSAQLQAKESEIGSLTAINSSLQNQLTSISSELADTKDRLALSNGVIQQLREDSVLLEKRHREEISQQTSTHERELLLVQESHSSEISRLSKKFSSDMEREREVRDGERKRIYEEIDKNRTAMEREKEKSAASVEAARRESEASKTLAESFRSQNATLQSRNAFLEGSMKAMQSELDRLRLEVDLLRTPPSPPAEPEDPAPKQTPPPEQ